jgi:hypothetical protein
VVPTFACLRMLVNQRLTGCRREKTIGTSIGYTCHLRVCVDSKSNIRLEDAGRSDADFKRALPKV